MKKIKKVFVAYQLDKAIEDVTRIEVEYSDYQFTLSMLNGQVFNSESEAIEFINREMNDYAKRNVDKETRFVILQTYVFEDDEVFKVNE